MCTLTEQELEFHYSPSQWTHRMSPSQVVGDFVARSAEDSRTALWTLDAETEISYGKSERQKFDIFHKKNTPKKGAPIFVFLHGGYWQIKDVCRENSGFMAVPLCNAGASVVTVDYDLAPDVTLDEMILQVKKAVHMVIKLAKERQSSGIYLSGHSAGGHLACMMLMSAFSEYDAFDSEIIKGAILVSGLYDLRPITKTSNNDALGLSEEDAWRFSPLNFVSEIAQQSQHRHVSFVVGEYDPPEFRRQSGEMEKLLRDSGVRTSYMEVPDTDHFDVINKLSEPNFLLSKEIIRLMGL
ncbi:kynurenine formamidase [Aplysia californica]|uniref:Kynurenine formamidase n=1 Tax=Aplysia californica TaxID=6500 RepID=A0ABM0KA11_APLCA|nr:kynurenine formamidase [Aplysia californica]